MSNVEPSAQSTPLWVRNRELDAIRTEFYDNSYTAHVADYGIPREAIPEIFAHAGLLRLIRASRGLERCYIDPDGERHLAIEAFEPDGVTVADLVFWHPDRPADVATAIGAATGLGLAQIRNPASFYGGRALRVHRTPLAWLRASCVGVVILDRASAREWLPDALGPIAAEDIDHGRDLARLLSGKLPASRILASIPDRAR